jgi:hypothetical protein
MCRDLQLSRSGDRRHLAASWRSASPSRCRPRVSAVGVLTASAAPIRCPVLAAGRRAGARRRRRRPGPGRPAALTRSPPRPCAVPDYLAGPRADAQHVKLTGTPQPAPWDPELSQVMAAAGRGSAFPAAGAPAAGRRSGGSGGQPPPGRLRPGSPSRHIRTRREPEPGRRFVQLCLGERAVLRLPLVQGSAEELIAQLVGRRFGKPRRDQSQRAA